MSGYYVWVPCGEYNAVHGHYATIGEAEAAVDWLYNRYKSTTRVHGVISGEVPPSAKRWIIHDQPVEGNRLIEEAL